jgi:hypothetical protein
MQPAHRPRPRALRIGVVLGDTLIAEHLLEAGTFSIGRKASCTVPLPLPGLPPRWELLTIDGRGMRLRLGAAMDVRLADGGAVRTRADLQPGGVAGARVLEVAIPARGRGKVVIDDVKVIFHDVEVAPPAPRPALPPELRETLAERVDRRLLAFAAASLALHVGVMAAARWNDPPAALGTAEQVMADYLAETTTVIDADELPPLPAPTPAPAASGVKQPAPAPEPSTAPAPAVDRPRPRPSTTPGPVADPMGDATRAADALFSDDPGTDPIAGAAARRKPGGDLAAQLAELAEAHARASIGGDGDRTIPHPDGPRLGTTEEPAPDIGDVRHTTPPKPELEHARVTLTPSPKPAPGEPSVEAIIAKIKTTYMSGLVRCYKRAMAEAGPMSGKVVLAFEVGERGAVTAASATGVDDGLERCVEGLMTGWRFVPVVDGDGDPTDVDVKLTLQLRPD